MKAFMTTIHIQQKISYPFLHYLHKYWKKPQLFMSISNSWKIAINLNQDRRLIIWTQMHISYQHRCLWYMNKYKECVAMSNVVTYSAGIDARIRTPEGYLSENNSPQQHVVECSCSCPLYSHPSLFWWQQQGEIKQIIQENKIHSFQMETTYTRDS
jgi:hypothetical protein